MRTYPAYRDAHGALHHIIPGYVPFQLSGEHTTLQPCGASNLSYNIIVISVPSSTYLHLSEVKQLMLKGLAQGQNVKTTVFQYCEGRTMIIL